MKTNLLRALFLTLIAASGCAPPPVECVTRNVLEDRVSRDALDCGSFSIATVDGVSSIENPETLDCANRAIAAAAPFVVRRDAVVGVSNCGSSEMCPLVRGAVSAWIGDTVGGSYTVTQVFDSADVAAPSMALRAHLRSCAPMAGATLRFVSPSSRLVSIQCSSAGAGPVELDELLAESSCAVRDR